MGSTDAVSLIVSASALIVSAITLWRQFFYFRGTEIRLANEDDGQDCVVLRFGALPAAVRELFPNYDDILACAFVRAVWLNTGDRAGYVHIRDITTNGVEGRAVEVARHGYVDVPASSATLQGLLIWGISDDNHGPVTLRITYDWPLITRNGESRQTSVGELRVNLIGPKRRS